MAKNANANNNINFNQILANGYKKSERNGDIKNALMQNKAYINGITNKKTNRVNLQIWGASYANIDFLQNALKIGKNKINQERTQINYGISEQIINLQNNKAFLEHIKAQNIIIDFDDINAKIKELN